MTDQYHPPEEKIAEVIEKTGGDPRKLAVAYLRAQHRARQAELAFGFMEDVQDLAVAAFSGDVDGAEKAVESARRRNRTSQEIKEA